MSDHPIPDDLVKRLVDALDPYDIPPGAHHTIGPDADTWRREPITVVLQALAEWADGAIIAPNGWRRLDAEEVALIEVVEWTDDGLPVNFGIDLTNPGECCDGDTLYTLTERTGT